MSDFAPPMISMTYDQGAKPFDSLCEMNSFVFAGFRTRRGAKRKDREIDGGPEPHASRRRRATEAFGGQRQETTRKWRRKSLESLKPDSGLPMRWGAVASKENR
jgi:hypothetical protein